MRFVNSLPNSLHTTQNVKRKGLETHMDFLNLSTLLNDNPFLWTCSWTLWCFVRKYSICWILYQTISNWGDSKGHETILMRSTNHYARYRQNLPVQSPKSSNSCPKMLICAIMVSFIKTRLQDRTSVLRSERWKSSFISWEDVVKIWEQLNIRSLGSIRSVLSCCSKTGLELKLCFSL